MRPANSYWYDNKTLIQIITDGQPVSFRQLRGFAAGVRYRFHTDRLQQKTERATKAILGHVGL